MSEPLNDLNTLAASAKIDHSLLSACIHCGLCLPACPTYLATGREMESPRGRIHLLNLLQKGELDESDRLVEHIDTCLGCLGCQTACPSGVQYGKILDQARPIIAKHRSAPVRELMRFAFAQLLPDYPRLNLLGRLLRFAQKTGLASAPQKLPAPLKKLLGPLAEWSGFLPDVPPHKPLPKQSWAAGEKSGEVQLFSGCVMDVFYNDVNHASIRLLNAQKQIVRVPEQTCCGALAFHAGEVDIAVDLAKRNIEYFESLPGAIVVTSAGCGALLKEYGHLLHDYPEWAERAAAFSKRVQDITEFLALHDFVPESKSLNKKVAYHAACHLSHAQGIRQQPEFLLKQINNAIPVPLNESEHCCGSAGIYNLLHTDISLKVLDRKMANVAETEADILVTTNPGCLLQLQKGLRDCGSSMRAVHLVTLLDEAFS